MSLASLSALPTADEARAQIAARVNAKVEIQRQTVAHAIKTAQDSNKMSVLIEEKLDPSIKAALTDLGYIVHPAGPGTSIDW